MLLYVSSFVTILLLLYIQLAAVNARVAVDRTAKGSVSGAERHGAVILVLAHAVIYPSAWVSSHYSFHISGFMDGSRWRKMVHVRRLGEKIHGHIMAMHLFGENSIGGTGKDGLHGLVFRIQRNKS